MKRFYLLAVLSLSLHAETVLETGYRHMYNLRFHEAHQTFALYEESHPGDPLGPASDAAAWLFSEFERLDILRSEFAVKDASFFSTSKRQPADPKVKAMFEAALAKAQQLSEAALRKSPSDADASFAVIMRLGLHADYLALIEKREIAALSEIKQARERAQLLLASHPDYYDAWIAVALENYLLSLKAAPVRWLLRATGSQTDKQTGLDKLRLTAGKGHYLAPYARLLRAIAELRDNDRVHAKQDLQWLASEFPANHLYREELAQLN